MAFLFSRGIVRCHSLSIARHSGGFCARNQVSLRRVQAMQDQCRTTFKTIQTLMYGSTQPEGNGHREFGTLSKVQPTQLSVATYDYVKIITNGARYFSTSNSTCAQASNQPTDGRLVYKGDLNTMLKLLKIFSLSSSFLGCAMVPIIISNSNSIVSLIFASFAGVTIFTPLLLHWFTKGYVTHLYFNSEEDMYTAVSYTLLLRAKRLQFTPDDVKVPAIRNLFTSFTAKDVPLLVDDTRFENPNDVMHLKGYDKMQGSMSLDDLKELYEKEEGLEQKQ